MRAALVVLHATCWLAWHSPVRAQETPQSSGARRADGALVDVGGHKLFIRCVGPAGTGPTVVLEAGGGGTTKEWAKVQDLLSSRVRTCAYDRAGLGSSEPGPSPRTLRQEVFELHELLAAAKLPPPYVLAGQSIGGMLVRLYTEKYDSEVVGVVLVDPLHENDMLGSIQYGGWVRLREKARDRAVPEPRRTGPVSTQYNPDEDYLAEELQQIYLARKANPAPLGNRPLIVLAAGIRPPPPGTPDSLWAWLRVEKDGQKVDLSRLSGNSRFLLDPASTHALHVDDPELVARAIQDVLTAAVTGARLGPWPR